MKSGMKIINGKTTFELKWGLPAKEIAQQDGTTSEAIYSRVARFGSPYQRKAKPGIWERVYCKTLWELTDELDMHPMSIQNRHYSCGNVYETKSGKSHPSKGSGDSSQWLNQPQYKKLAWLHELHPDYEAWRKNELDYSKYGV
jgi:hypothetical protein